MRKKKYRQKRTATPNYKPKVYRPRKLEYARWEHAQDEEHPQQFAIHNYDADGKLQFEACICGKYCLPHIDADRIVPIWDLEVLRKIVNEAPSTRHGLA